VDDLSLRNLLTAVRNGTLDVEAALARLGAPALDDLGYAHVDHGRHARCGAPEIIFCEGKTVEQVLGITRSLVQRGSHVLATRAWPGLYEAVKAEHPTARFEAAARAVVLQDQVERVGRVLIISAGTSDIPVAEEARVTAEFLGSCVACVYDVGVAGIHRLLAHSREMADARSIVVVAGMEGALASVVGGLVAVPVIGVPTSVGYGASFGGLAPLLTMLNSCAAGVAVVNIDSGFRGGYLASLVNRAGERR
jgi:NCAIR mutase (PurE)-related protein